MESAVGLMKPDSSRARVTTAGSFRWSCGGRKLSGLILGLNTISSARRSPPHCLCCCCCCCHGYRRGKEMLSVTSNTCQRGCGDRTGAVWVMPSADWRFLFIIIYLFFGKKKSNIFWWPGWWNAMLKTNPERLRIFMHWEHQWCPAV